uniref:Uncharacterized protein n=1 Tax=Thermogemmatispora argillosa TaxID=2045280 RepID=A0A455T1Q0_9CHLR|nr:hypothetical protein KTA_14780 [Thermogemmatispora argillosa]
MEQERSYWLLAAVAETNVPRDAADPRRWERWHEGCEHVLAEPLERERLERLLAWEEQGRGGEEEPLEFAVPARALRLDYVPVGLHEGVGLASARLQGLLADYGVGHRVYRARLRQQRTGRELSGEYGLVVLPRERAEEVIAWERTEVVWWLSERCVRTLGIKESWAKRGRLLVGLMEVGSTRVARVLVEERLRRALEGAKLRGLACAPLSACLDPCGGVRAEGLRAYLERYPEDEEGWYRLGAEYGGLCHYEKGLEAFERALELRPDDARVWELRGRHLWELGRKEEAVESARRAWELGREEEAGGWRYAWGYGRMLRKVGRAQEAVRVLEEEARRGRAPDDRLWYELGRGYQEQGEEQEALEALERGLAVPFGRRRFSWELYLRQGQVLAKLGRQEEALAAYEGGLRWLSGGLELWRGKLEALRALGREEEAEEAERKVRRLEAAEAAEKRREKPPYPF